MKHVIQHGLSDELARKTCKKAIESYAERFENYEPTSVWSNEDRADIAFNAKGVKLNGSIVLSPGEIALALEVPFLFRPFKKKAINIIDNQIRTWIEKAGAGELDG
jgi:hypothetical protein